MTIIKRVLKDRILHGVATGGERDFENFVPTSPPPSPRGHLGKGKHCWNPLVYVGRDRVLEVFPKKGGV